MGKHWTGDSRALRYTTLNMAVTIFHRNCEMRIRISANYLIIPYRSFKLDLYFFSRNHR